MARTELQSSNVYHWRETDSRLQERICNATALNAPLPPSTAMIILVIAPLVIYATVVFSLPVPSPSGSGQASTFSIILSLMANYALELPSSETLNPYPGKPKVTFAADGTFKITVFSDLHFGENPWDTWGPEQDVNSTRLMRTVLSDEKPDYV